MAFEILSVNHGNGRHMFYLDHADVIEASKWSRATIPPNLMACLMARISLCLFMMRIVNRNRTYMILLWVIIALNSVTTSASIIQLLAGCRPIEKLWNPKAPGVCLPAKVTLIIGLLQATSTIASDWILALLPILILKDLNMARRTKIVLSILMGTGLFVGVAALVKTLSLYTLGARVDVTWDTFNLTCWSMYALSQNPRFNPIFTLADAIPQNRAKPRHHSRQRSRHPPALLALLQDGHHQPRDPQPLPQRLRPREHGGQEEGRRVPQRRGVDRVLAPQASSPSAARRQRQRVQPGGRGRGQPP